MTLPILILPCWMYHATQGGKIFRTREEIDEAEAQGWRDSPAAARATLNIDHQAVDLPGSDEPTPDDGVEAVLDASEAALADAEVVEALEGVEDLIIEKVQAAVSKKRKSKTS